MAGSMEGVKVEVLSAEQIAQEIYKQADFLNDLISSAADGYGLKVGVEVLTKTWVSRTDRPQLIVSVDQPIKRDKTGG